MTTIVGLYLSRRGSEARARERERERRGEGGIPGFNLIRVRIGQDRRIYICLPCRRDREYYYSNRL